MIDSIPIVKPKLEKIGWLVLHDPISTESIDVRHAAAIFSQLMERSNVEELWELGLDEARRPLWITRLSEGTPDWVLSHKSRFLQAPLLSHTLGEAIKREAVGIILGHNHFISAEPSSADEGLTRQIVAAARYVGIQVLDHVIVCPAPVQHEAGKYFSFFEQGRIVLTE